MRVPNSRILPSTHPPFSREFYFFIFTRWFFPLFPHLLLSFFTHYFFFPWISSRLGPPFPLEFTLFRFLFSTLCCWYYLTHYLHRNSTLLCRMFFSLVPLFFYSGLFLHEFLRATFFCHFNNFFFFTPLFKGCREVKKNVEASVHRWPSFYIFIRQIAVGREEKKRHQVEKESKLYLHTQHKW